MQLRVHDNSLAIDDVQYQAWIAGTEAARLSAQIVTAWEHCQRNTPRISILLPTYNSDAEFLRATLDSVLAQIYPHWQLCIVDDASSEPHVRPLLQEYAQRDARIHLQFQAENGGIAASSNCALAAAAGDYVAMLDHDDVLAPHALLLVAASIAQFSPDVLYSDSDCLNEREQRVEPFFKPGWNYDLLLGQNYINHLTVYRTQRVIDVGGWRAGFEGSQDYDLLLRAVEQLPESRIHHIPAILYHWRQVPTSVSRANLGAAVKAARNAIREHLQRTGQSASVKPCAGAVLYNRIAWQVTTTRTAVAIYGCEQALIDRTQHQLRQLDADLAIDGVLLAGDDCQPLNAWAARQSASTLGFIAAGFTLESFDALAGLLGHASRPAVAAVSAKLTGSHGRPQGPLLADANTVTAAYRAAGRDNTGYVASLLLDREVFALQAGCLFVDAALFDAVGGWTRSPCDSLLAGVDLSLRLRAGHRKVIWSGQAVAVSGNAALDAEIARTEVDTTALRAQYPQDAWLDRNINVNLAQ